MAIYDVTIDGVDYEVESEQPLTDVQAYNYALQNSKAPSGNDFIPTQANLERSRLQNLENQKARQTADEERTFGDKLLGAGEAVLSTVTGIPASAIGAIGSLPTALSPSNYGTARGADVAEQRMSDIAQSLTYQPRTQAGQEYLGNISEGIERSGIAGLAGMPMAPKVAGAKELKSAVKAGRATPNLTEQVVGMTTGTGGEALMQAYKAGKVGGEKGKVFAENMRKDVPVDAVLKEARDSLQQMKANKSAEYVTNKSGWAADQTILDFTPIEQSFKSLEDSLKVTDKSGKSKWKISKPELSKIQEVKQVINEWKRTPSLHTTLGLDALKQRIDAIYPESPKQSQAQRVITGASKSVKDTIIKQAPDYANAMKDYESMSSLINEIESALSLGNKKSKDTALRKLQSLTRNNVQTNYGGRLDMVKDLEAAGAGNILPAVSGQALSSLVPRGLAGQGIAGGATIASIGSLLNPKTLALLPFTSPRLMGEAAYMSGRASNYLPNLPSAQYIPPPLYGLLGAEEER